MEHLIPVLHMLLLKVQLVMSKCEEDKYEAPVHMDELDGLF